MEVDSYYAAECSFKSFTASLHKSTVRLEIDNPSSAVIHIFDGAQSVAMRLDWMTITCLKRVIKEWEAKEDKSSDVKYPSL